MAMDFNIIKGDLENRFTLFTFTNAIEGDGFTAAAALTSTSVVEATSAWQMTLWDAYANLADILMEGITAPISLTQTQIDAISTTDMLTAYTIWNLTDTVMNTFDGTVFQEPSVFPLAFGEMVEESATGSVIPGFANLWATATVGEIDANGNVTFQDSDIVDSLVIGSGGAGIYDVNFGCTFTNAGALETIATILVNGIVTLIDTHLGSSTEQRPLSASGFLPLETADQITLHIVSTTPTDVITVFHCHVSLRRIN